jgi:hypothetical protein
VTQKTVRELREWLSGVPDEALVFGCWDDTLFPLLGMAAGDIQGQRAVVLDVESGSDGEPGFADRHFDDSRKR